MVAAKAASAATMLVVAGLAARILPIEAVGSYFLAYSIVAVLGVALSFGMGDLGLRLVARATLLEGAGHVGRVVRRVLALMLLALTAAATVGLAGAAVLGGLGRLPAGLSVLVACLIVIWGTALACRLVLSGILRAIGKVVFSNVCANLVASALTAALLGGWWLAGTPGRLEAVISISVGAAVASTWLAFALLRHFVAEPIWSWRLERPRELLRDGLPIAAVKLLASMVLQGPLWTVAAFGGAAEAALYGASVRVAQSLGAAQTVSNLVGAPHVVTLQARGETRRLSRMSQALSLFALAPPLLTLGALLLLGREFMTLVFGPAFSASAGPLIILTAGRALQMAVRQRAHPAADDRPPACAPADRRRDGGRRDLRRGGRLPPHGHQRHGRRRVASDGRGRRGDGRAGTATAGLLAAQRARARQPREARPPAADATLRPMIYCCEAVRVGRKEMEGLPI